MKSESSKINLNDIPGFSLLTDKERVSIQKDCFIVTYKEGDVIFRQGSPVSYIMYVQSGLVKIQKEITVDKEIIFCLADSGSWIGQMTVFGGEIHQYSCVATGQVDIVMVRIAIFWELIRQNGDFACHILKESNQQSLKVITKLFNHSQKHLPGRVAEMLLYFSEEIYNSPKFILPLSRRELAYFVGTTKESMIRTLAEFRHDKIIELDDKQVEILSFEAINILSRYG